MTYTEFENAVTNKITNSLDITRTDAQAIIEADGNLEILFSKGLSVEECVVYYL